MLQDRAIKLTPSSTLRRRTRTAESGSLGGPQIPSPVMRMAPKPRRRTLNSPHSAKVPVWVAGGLSVFPPAVYFRISKCSLQVECGGIQRNIVPTDSLALAGITVADAYGVPTEKTLG